MTYRESARTTTRRIPGAVVPVARRIRGVLLAGLRAVGTRIARSPGRPVRPQDRAGLGKTHGAVPAGVTVFDDDVPAVTRLDPALLSALRRAATAAADGGVELCVNSGWRSPEYQSRLLREAVAKYGSAAAAARWVATPETSIHVAGKAVDIGPPASASWLSEHGADYGLCRVYRNEPWHFELRPEAIEHGCPPLYADPSHDPRLRR
ncbi:peptidase M15 [Amycolatopsis balhimycina DSM 5908]|uniref:Peptidase M15 n=2 Tax=Amycolatopsis balhimycina TaxID=208443 RepID=A0A428X5S8_AMYBA|nr:M15 family metallopeptidase [Amycolatopsis balhimycina]RSM50659.1 peptidase M15 [Amycolatopsis balhimycina DSM 5908]CAG25753.1 putative VanY-type carboxypeptidase [Amycolatopsis balhimycina DSM 5908]